MAIGQLQDLFGAFVPRALPSKGDVVVFLWAGWCRTSCHFKPIFDEVSSGENNNTRFEAVNLDEDPLTARRFGSVVIPALIRLRNGEEMERTQGILPEDDFSVLLRGYYNGNGGAEEAHS